MKPMRHHFFFICLGLIALCLTACSHPPCDKYLKHPPYVPQEKLIKLKKPINVVQRREYDICLLQREGVQVIRLGQTWKLVFPSDDLFDNDTAEINNHYKPVLYVAVDFMRTYSKISVKVASFSNKIENDVMTKFGTVTDELTTRQADAVLKYFTSQHIYARLIYAEGEGGRHAVAWNGSADGRRFNRRVEVSFKYYRDNRAWY